MFDAFPKRWWKNHADHDNAEQMTNLCLRVSIPERFREDATLYLSYVIQDGETPQDISEKIYDDATLFWTIYYANQILDPTENWPLSVDELHDTLVSKYGYAGMAAVHHYEDLSGNIVDPEAIQFMNGFNDLSIIQIVEYYSLRTISVEQYYTSLNEQKRRIRLIDPEYIYTFKADMERLIND